MIDLHGLLMAYAECIVPAWFVGSLVIMLGLAKTRSGK